MRFHRSLQWRITLTYTALIFVSLAVMTFFLTGILRDLFISNLEKRLAEEAGLVSEASSQHLQFTTDSSSLQGLSLRLGQRVDARVTIVANDGTVLADSWEDPASMENQGDRPEVRQALISGLDYSTRYDDINQQEMLYAATPIRVDSETVGVARLAVPSDLARRNINSIISSAALSALVVALLSVALGYLIAHRTSRSVRSVTEGARRLAGGDLDHRVRGSASDETQDLANAFNRMADSLKEVIESLSDERNTLSAVLDTMADGVVVADTSGRVLLLNQAARGLLGVGRQITDNARLIELVRDHNIHQLVNRCQAERSRLQAEVELLYPRRYLSAIATPLEIARARGVLLTLHDLTRIRQVETSQKEFVSNVSHELRNPLASIKAMVETLEFGAIGDRRIARDFLQRMHGDVDRINNLVNDLLELSRLESGQFSLRTEPLALAPLVQSVKSQFQESAKRHEVTIETAVPEDLPPIQADGDKLSLVLANLVENALKFTAPQGQITIEAAADDGTVSVKLKDTGTGIAPEHLPHLFERFYKVDRARRDGGTGLGLAIVKQVVQAHGGQVKVESQEGVGSTFTFTIPSAD